VPVAGIPDHGHAHLRQPRFTASTISAPRWSLGVANVRVEKNRNARQELDVEYERRAAEPSPNYCLQTLNNSVVTVTFPDGTQYLFQPVATPQCQQIVPMTAATIGFNELPGGSPGTEGATLVPADGGQVLFDGSVPAT
jgi:hypothetical protein